MAHNQLWITVRHEGGQWESYMHLLTNNHTIYILDQTNEKNQGQKSFGFWKCNRFPFWKLNSTWMHPLQLEFVWFVSIFILVMILSVTKILQTGKHLHKWVMYVTSPSLQWMEVDTLRCQRDTLIYISYRVQYFSL